MCASISRLRPNRSLGSGDQHTQNSNRVRMLAWEKCCRGSAWVQPSRQKACSHTPVPTFSQSKSTAQGIKRWQGPHFLISGNHPGCSAPACSPLLILPWPGSQQYYTMGLLPTPWRPHADVQLDPACPHMQTRSNRQSDTFLEHYYLQLEHSLSTSDRCHHFP